MRLFRLCHFITGIKKAPEGAFFSVSKLNDRLSASDNSFHKVRWRHPHHPATALCGWFPHPDRVICHSQSQPGAIFSPPGSGSDTR